MALLADGVSELFIDGKMSAGSAGTFPTINPATEEVLGVAADADAEDMGRAIDAARRAFDDTDWSRNVELRVRCVRQLREAMQQHLEELRDITIAEVGAPRMLTGSLSSKSRSTTWRSRRTPPNPTNGTRISARHRRWVSPPGAPSPVRPLVSSAPSHRGTFPHQINLAKIGPALAAGNTVVLKPAPDTPWCAAVLGELIAEHTDFPPGVVNIVTSSDHSVGAMLSKDPRVDMVSFTGSTATGRAVMADGAATIKKVFLELGGKSAFIVLDDADLSGARGRGRRSPRACTPGRVARSPPGWWCRGRGMTRPSRSRPRPWAASRPATPTDPGTICGPVISARQRDRVQGYLDSAIAEGGTFACGGGRPADREVGFFIEPTVIAGLGNDARCAREEIFGPVLTVIAARRRRRRGAHRQRLAIRVVGHGVRRGPGEGGQGSPRGSARARSMSMAACGIRPMRRSAGTSNPETVARWVWPASRSTWKPRPLRQRSN